MIFDESTGLIVRKELDGSIGWGDSCAETFRYFHLLYVRKFLEISNEGLSHQLSTDIARAYTSIKSPIPFRYQRAPAGRLPQQWGDPIKDFSSDQEIPLICALGVYEYGVIAKGIQSELGWFWQNGQPILGDGYACFRRAQGKSSNIFLDDFLWPTVFARCGVFPTWDSGIKKIRWGDPTDTADDLNLIHLFLQCEYTSHTWTSKRAMQFYSKHRDIHKAVQTYYSDEPDKYMLYASVIEKVFK